MEPCLIAQESALSNSGNFAHQAAVKGKGKAKAISKTVPNF